jgi:hypothetical protein
MSDELDADLDAGQGEFLTKVLSVGLDDPPVGTGVADGLAPATPEQ